MRRQAALILLGATALAVIVFLAFPDLDLMVARHLLRPDGHFILHWVMPFLTIHFWVPAPVIACLGFFGLIAAADLLGRPILGLTRWHALYVAAVFAIGPGLLANTLLKDHSGRPRPQAVQEFGGSMPYAPPFSFNGACSTNCSFVSGDAAAVFAFIGPALLLPPGRRKVGIAAVLLLGSAIGLMRMLQGGHFLSDVIFAGLLVTATAISLHWAMFRPDGEPRRPMAREIRM